MRGYYWKHPGIGKWFWRKSLKTDDWLGPYQSKFLAKSARADFYENIAIFENKKSGAKSLWVESFGS